MEALLIVTGVFTVSSALAFLIVSTYTKFSEHNKAIKQGYVSAKDSNHYTSNELKNLNQLYYCRDCERYTRNHMMELKLLKAQLESGKANLSKCCPNCASDIIGMAKEEYSWQENHRHCFKLKPDQYSEYKNDVQKWRNAIKDAEELKAFEEYESKHLANGPRQSPSDDLKKEEARHLIERFKNSLILDCTEFDNVIIKETNGDIHAIRRTSFDGALYGDTRVNRLVEKNGYEVFLLPDNRLLLHNHEKLRPPVSMMDSRRELEETRRKNAQAQLNRAFEMHQLDKVSTGGVTLKEVAESLAAYQKNWR